jgi:hypothetical protein
MLHAANKKALHRIPPGQVRARKKCGQGIRVARSLTFDQDLL